MHDSLDDTDSLVHHFGPDGNISTVVGQFDVLGLQRMRSGDFSDPLTFYYEVKTFCFAEEISELTLTLPSPSLLQKLFRNNSLRPISLDIKLYSNIKDKQLQHTHPAQDDVDLHS